jgi:hypothetical protein
MESDCTELLRRADVPADQIQVALGADMRLLGHATRSASTFAGLAPRAAEEPRLTAAFELTYARPYGRTPPGYVDGGRQLARASGGTGTGRAPGATDRQRERKASQWPVSRQPVCQPRASRRPLAERGVTGLLPRARRLRPRPRLRPLPAPSRSRAHRPDHRRPTRINLPSSSLQTPAPASTRAST